MSKQKNDYNFLLLVFGKAWGYVPKSTDPFTSNPSTSITAQDPVQKKKSLQSHSNNSKRKESYGRKHKQKKKSNFHEIILLGKNKMQIRECICIYLKKITASNFQSCNFL